MSPSAMNLMRVVVSSSCTHEAAMAGQRAKPWTPVGGPMPTAVGHLNAPLVDAQGLCVCVCMCLCLCTTLRFCIVSAVVTSFHPGSFHSAQRRGLRWSSRKALAVVTAMKCTEVPCPSKSMETMWYPGQFSPNQHFHAPSISWRVQFWLMWKATHA